MAEDHVSLRGASLTALNAVQALGRGFDVTCDIRLLYCKGAPCTRLVKVDEGYKRDLELQEDLALPNVTIDIRSRPENCTSLSSGVLDFDQMSELFNRQLRISGKVPLGVFNAMFSLAGSWQADALGTKSLAIDGYNLPLYSVHLRSPFLLCDEVQKAVPTTWDPVALASFIEKYGTHIIIGVQVGGKDFIYVKQHQSSALSKSEIEVHLKKLADYRFRGVGISTQDMEDKDITVIYRRRGGDDLIQDHLKWRETIKENPDVVSMSFYPIVLLLDDGPGTENLNRAIDAYLKYKPPLEELQYFLDFLVPRVWTPTVSIVGTRKEPVCPSLQFSLMGPKLYISTDQVSVGRKPVTGLRLSLEGSKLNRLAVHVQQLTTLPKILQPYWGVYVAIGASKWHGPEEQDSRWFEPVQWKNFAHVSTAPVEYNETWFGDASEAYIVTGAQLGVWDFGVRSVLHLKLLYSKVPRCTIRRSVWDHTPVALSQLGKLKNVSASNTSSSATLQSQKLSKFIDRTEMLHGPQDSPGHWLVTGAKLCVEKSNVSLRVKYSLLNY